MDKETLFRQVLETHRDRIYRICCGYVRDRTGRDDAYQETLIRIWKNLGSFEGRSQIGTWIYRITVNTCLRYLATEKRRLSVVGNGLDEAADVADSLSGDGPAGTAGECEELYRAIHQLPEIDRALVSLILEDLSTKEIAEILEISEVNVRVRLHRARRTLRTILERNGHGSR